MTAPVPQTPAERPVRREPRWPPAAALLVLIALPFLLPERLTFGSSWILPAAEGLLLVAIVAVDPSRTFRRRTTPVRALAIALTVALILGATWSTARLTDELIHGGPDTQSAASLLSTGALVWINNNTVFGFLYWELDSGGPAARARQAPRHPDFLFPGHANPHLVPHGWRPVFVDYLYLGLTNAMAFSPTDVMPMAPWTKLTMALQSLISITVLSLVIARAVNVMA